MELKEGRLARGKREANEWIGYDSVGFGRDPGEGGPMRVNVIVAQIESQSWWGGLLGLSPEPIKYILYLPLRRSPLPSLFIYYIL